jgi:adenylyltransferase/sulfurtransferase
MKEFLLRYQRQITLEAFGMSAQEKLKNAKVLVIGAGGLGCPALQYLVAAGVGYIGIADNDTVQLSNLNRQILFGQNDLGKKKALVAKEKLLQLNDTVQIEIFDTRWKQEQCIQHFPDYDIIIDASDNFATRYLINDACVLMHKPLVFGAVSKMEGQVAVFNNRKEACNYRDVFPIPPSNKEVLNCAEGGVLGVLPGMIGVMQATEAIKIITGIGQPLTNQLLSYNALSQQFYTIQIVKHPQAVLHMPANLDTFLITHYEDLCQ